MTGPPRKPGPAGDGAGIRAARRHRPLDGARLTAYDVLDGVSARAAYANLLLPQLLRERQLERARRRLRHPAGLRHAARQGTLDAVLTGLVSRPLAELDPRVLDLLRLGAYQLSTCGCRRTPPSTRPWT